MPDTAIKKPSWWYALLAFFVPISLILFGILFLNPRLYDKSLPGVSPAVYLVMAIVTASLMCFPLVRKWEALQDGIVESLGRIQTAMIILLVVGMIISSWIASGTIPAIIYWGLKLIAPEHFMLSTMIICSVASLATGTSFGTMGTVGVALLAVGQTMGGYSDGMIVGAIVAGAYMGDKMSPVSDTTNVAAAVCGINIFQHIYSMLYTAVPAFIVCAIFYAFLGGQAGGDMDVERINRMISGLEASFDLSWYAFIPPILLFGLAFLRQPVVPVLIISLVSAVVIGLLTAPQENLIDAARMMSLYLHSGYVSVTENAELNRLLARGGIMSTAGTVVVCYAGMALGGVFERARVLEVLIDLMLSGAKSTLRLVMSALGASLVILVGTGAQMLAIIIPGRAFSGAFKKANLHGSVLSRCCEDIGTLFSPLVPWSVPAFFILGVLKVSAWDFAPWAVMNWIVPLFSAIWAVTGIGIWNADGSSRSPFARKKAAS